VSIALIAGALMVWFAQTMQPVQTIHEESIFNVVLHGDRPDELFEHEDMQRVRCLRDVNAA
jgi:hypothetical protein